MFKHSRSPIELLKITILLTLSITITQIKTEVIFAFEHFRHGLSEVLKPEQSIPFLKDIYKIKIEGDGELTPIGMRMQYLIGFKNRQKYNKLLSKTYDPKEVLIYSSQQTKAIMSAQAQLIGMFPPHKGSQLSDEDLLKAIPPNKLNKEIEQEKIELGNSPLPGNVQVVPIHLLNEKEVQLLQSDPESCYPLNAIKEKLRSSLEVKTALDSLNENFGEKLRKFFNKTDLSFIYDYRTIYILTNNFMIDYTSGINLDKFKEYDIDIDEFYDECYRIQKIFLFQIESNEEMSILALSPTIKKIISWMDARVKYDMKNEQGNKDYNEPKFVMYSGHAKTLVPFELFMKKIFKTPLRYPHFGSSLYLELHREDRVFKSKDIDNYYIQYSVDGELFMKIPYSQFKDLVMHNVWSDDRILNYCQVPLATKFLFALVVAALVVSLTTFVAISCFFDPEISKREQKKKFAEDSNKRGSGNLFNELTHGILFKRKKKKKKLSMDEIDGKDIELILK